MIFRVVRIVYDKERRFGWYGFLIEYYLMASIMLELGNYWFSLKYEFLNNVEVPMAELLSDLFYQYILYYKNKEFCGHRSKTEISIYPWVKVKSVMSSCFKDSLDLEFLKNFIYSICDPR